MIINFYSMPGCGYCTMSKKLFENEINKGVMKVLPHDKAPKGVMGFPYFEYNNLSFNGYPGNKENLFKNLGIKKLQCGGRNNGKYNSKKKKLSPWQKFLKKHKGKGWSIQKFKKEYTKL